MAFLGVSESITPWESAILGSETNAFLTAVGFPSIFCLGLQQSGEGGWLAGHRGLGFPLPEVTGAGDAGAQNQELHGKSVAGSLSRCLN